jgi:predicted nuclease of predicted toxin-antitoxin system
LKFLIDANLPPALAHWLKNAGEDDAVHVFDLGQANALDTDIWRLAQRDEYIILTKDVDFAYLAIGDSEGPHVVWLRCGNLTLTSFKSWFDARWREARALLEDGAHLVEMR